MPSDTRTGMPLHIPGCFDRNITPLMPFGIGGFFVGFWADSRFCDGILRLGMTWKMVRAFIGGDPSAAPQDDSLLWVRWRRREQAPALR